MRCIKHLEGRRQKKVEFLKEFDFFYFIAKLKPIPFMNKRSKKKAMTRSGQIFKQAAQSLLVSKQPGLGAFARKLKARRRAAIAIKATARKIAELYYKTFDNGMQYVEKGVEIYL
jgi:hypothetical protein